MGQQIRSAFATERCLFAYFWFLVLFFDTGFFVLFLAGAIGTWGIRIPAVLYYTGLSLFLVAFGFGDTRHTRHRTPVDCRRRDGKFGFCFCFFGLFQGAPLPPKVKPT
jgi:hypothetical protein